MWESYRKNKIYNIHDTEDQVCNLRLVITITCENQHCGDDVMCEHLPMVFSPSLDIDDHDLLKPESVLCKNIPFPQPSNFSIWPVCPEFFKVEPVFGVH